MAGFITTPLYEKSPIVPRDFRHAMCIGETGCGKTTSFILPNIQDRLAQGHGLFVLDYKGTLHQHVKGLAMEASRIGDIVELGVPWGGSFGLLKGVSKQLFLEGLECLIGEEEDKFWSTSSLSTVGLLFESMEIMDHLAQLGSSVGIERSNPYELSLQSLVRVTQGERQLRRFCTQMELFCSTYDTIALANYYQKPYHRTFALLYQYVNLLKTHHGHLNAFVKTIDESRPSSGSGGVLFQMRNLLLSLDMPSFHGTEDVVEMLEKGKVVLLRCDTYPPRMAIVLMHLLYTRLAKRLTCNRPVSLFMDEFHRSLTKDALPFVDVFREKKVELIGALQNMEQLEIVIGEKESLAFMGNVVHQYTYDDDALFAYEYQGKKAKATPLFLEKDTLALAQLSWQKTLEPHMRLEKEWVYEMALGSHTCLVRHTKTGRTKIVHLLHESEAFEEFLKHVEPNEAKERSLYECA